MSHCKRGQKGAAVGRGVLSCHCLLCFIPLLRQDRAETTASSDSPGWRAQQLLPPPWHFSSWEPHYPRHRCSVPTLTCTGHMTNKAGWKIGQHLYTFKPCSPRTPNSLVRQGRKTPSPHNWFSRMPTVLSKQVAGAVGLTCMVAPTV